MSLDASAIQGLRELQAHALPTDAPGAWIAAAIERLIADESDGAA